VMLVGRAGASGRIEVQTWIFDGNGWRHRPGLDSSSLSVSTAIGFDASARAMLAVSGNFSDGGTRTWSWDGIRWHAITTAHSPPAGVPMTLLNQPGSGSLLLISEAGGTFGTTTAEAWTWNGNDWVERSPLREDGAITYPVTAAGDGLHSQLWAFTEIPGATAAAARPLMAFRWNGGSWVAVPVARVTR
jgi:hypothetical protein